MIIKVHKAGRSFAGLSRYLMHDAKAVTTERVAWTHTLNLANDHVGSAIDEMLWTYRSADALKREAGIRAGGARLDKPVKHVSLSWPSGEAPDKQHMIETTQAYLKHMGYGDRQAVLIAHSDKRHAHVHVIMNSVSPEDGRAARSSNDWRRTEAFCAVYEREHGQIHCTQRLKPRQEREATPTRESWQRFKRSEMPFERAEIERLTNAPGYFERKDEKEMDRREWEALKAHQKREREQFFMDGRQAYRAARNEAFREVRQEFRPQWNAYYAALRSGGSKAPLAEMKAALVKAQNAKLDERRMAMSDELRAKRDKEYDAILEQQRFDRAELGRRQEQGLRTHAMFDVIYPVAEVRREPLARPEPPAGVTGPAKHHRSTSKAFDAARGGLVDPLDGHEAIKRAPAQIDRTTRDERQSVPAPAPARPKVTSRETTDVAVERDRMEKAREMTDQARSEGQDAEARALRASWNRHRRSRGGRD
jgi:hypothetical protein